MASGTENSETSVIIVDEDTTFLKVWKKVFRTMKNFNYYLTNDPQMALTLAKEHQVDLLISEVVMMSGNGFSLSEEIHNINPKADIILTTTYNCDFKRFNLNDPHFHILYKPYRSIGDVMHFITDIL
ncbi:MAG: hypothetical protein COV46_05000, partial [Deltaproteobacteria bacterium CG11_big_fil_rev_8_21_14_0_20_49_13]